MKRDLYEILCQWKRDKNRRPLLVLGARQVGKTFWVNEFGAREFDSLITLNFEKNPEYKEIFFISNLCFSNYLTSMHAIITI